MRRLTIGDTVITIALILLMIMSFLPSLAGTTPTSGGSLVAFSQTYIYFTITNVPASVTAGQSFSCVTVTVYNSDGTVDTKYNGKVYFTSTDPKAVLPYTIQNEYKFTSGHNGDRGVHVFSGFNLATIGCQTITVTGNSISTTTNPISVNHASPRRVQVAPKTATISAGNSQTYTATAIDYYGNSWGISSLAAWSITSGASGSWSGNSYTSASTGSWTVTCSYLGLGDSASLTVNHANANRFAINPKNPVATAGYPVVFSATAFDSFGNGWDVTGSIVWSVDAGSGVSWLGSACNATRIGTWKVTGSFNGLKDSASLTIIHAPAISIEVSPSTVTVNAGSGQTYTALATDRFANNWVVSSSTLWSIDSIAGGAWSQNQNTYVSAKAGTWTVQGTFEGMTSTACLTVVHGQAVSIMVSPQTVSVQAGSAQSYSTTAFDLFGNSWDSSSSSSLSIGPGASGSWNGNTYTSCKAGTWTIVDTCLGLTNNASITVVHASPVSIALSPASSSIMAGATQTYFATASDSYGNAWDVTSLTNWNASQNAGDSWTANNYTTTHAGTWTITGTYLGLSDHAYLIVNHESANSITITPNPATISAGSTGVFTATALDIYGNTWDVSSNANWSVSLNAGGSWNGNIYTSNNSGNSIVSVTFGSLSDSSSLIVNHGSVRSISINPSSSSTTAGSNISFTATASDYSGNTWDVTDLVTWSINVAAGGSWLNNVYAAETAGSWIVRGSYGVISNTASLTVNHGVANEISVGSTSDSIAAGQTQAFTATASDSYDNTWDVTDSVIWTIDSDAGGLMSANSYTSEFAGVWNVTSVFDGIVKSIYLSVNHAPADSVQITPYNASISVESRQAYSAMATDAFGNNWDVTDLISWSINSTAGGSWSANVYSPLNAGIWSVSATLENLSASAPVTINHGSANQLTISSSLKSIESGVAQQFTATVYDALGNSWIVSDSAVWSIDSAAGGSWDDSVYTSAKAGSWVVIGTVIGLSADFPLTVNHGTVTNITISPLTATINPDSEQVYSATASDFNENQWGITQSIIWTADAGAKGNWIQNVFVTSEPGTWTITGTSDGFSGTAQLTVVDSIHPSSTWLDLNMDGIVNFGDLVSFLQAYNRFGSTGIIDNNCDFNHDGQLNFQDLVIYISSYILYD